ncbi:hypothetical protein EC988_000113 [Linderina pennispora]|nr:hypothetical protein EC988_000113 [Linderina pennispora]
MTSLPMINLRAINWMMKGSVLSFILLSVCLGIHLILTVVMRKKHLADKIQYWYEPVSLIAGFLISHPIMYLYDGVQWKVNSQGFHFIGDPNTFKRNSWLILWGWVFAGVIFLVAVSFMVYIVMLSTFRGTIQYMQMPEGDDCLETLTSSSISKERKRLIRSVIMRIAMYPAVPIFTQGWVLAANTVTTLPYWLYVVASLMPALQGVLNFLVFLFNPAWDGQRRMLIDPFLKRIEKKQKPKQKDLESGSADMFVYHTNDSTIRLSPYQSRN